MARGAPARVELNRGALSASTRRRGLLLVLAVAFLYRAFLLWRVSLYPDSLGGSVEASGFLGPFLGSDRELMGFVTEGWWVGSPVYLFFSAVEESLGLYGQGILVLQALVGVICAGVLYRMTVSWLGYLAAVLAGLFFTCTSTSATGGLVLLPEFVFAWGGVLFLRHISTVVRRRDPGQCLRTGFAAGVLSILGGLGSLWILFVLAWLPLHSRAFRGRAYLQASWRLLLGWVLVISPGILQGAMAHGSFTPPFANFPTDLAHGIRSASVAYETRSDFPLDPAERYARQRTRLAEAGVTRARDLERAWAEAADPSVTLFRRARAFLGGTGADPAYLPSERRAALGMQRLPLFPTRWLLTLSWLGGIALLGSFRSFSPLYFGVAAPMAMAMGTGVGPQAWMMALPFLCLLAGYGCARVWLSRHTPATWLVAPLILALATLLTRGF